MKNKGLLFASLALSVALSGCAGLYHGDNYVEAQVLGLDRAPEVCEQKSQAAPIVLGAILGGMIGNQVGDGSGKKIATVAGVGAGAAVGERASRDDGLRCQSQGYIATVRYIHPETGKHVIDTVRVEEYTDATSLMVPFR